MTSAAYTVCIAISRAVFEALSIRMIRAPFAFWRQTFSLWAVVLCQSSEVVHFFSSDNLVLGATADERLGLRAVLVARGLPA